MTMSLKWWGKELLGQQKFPFSQPFYSLVREEQYQANHKCRSEMLDFISCMPLLHHLLVS